jgi:Luciferase-like monooxygenase
VVAPHVSLSVLDLAPVGEGSSPAAALQASLVLAREAERLGYSRYWVAEHHNMPGIASSSPAVLLAHASRRRNARSPRRGPAHTLSEARTRFAASSPSWSIAPLPTS